MLINEITFIIGNGFDLNCGLKSKYLDMYTGYIATEKETQVLKDFQQQLRNHSEENAAYKWSRWSDFEMGLADYAKELHSESELLECLEDFTRYMKVHLQLEEEHFIKYLKDNREWQEKAASEVDDSLFEFYEKLPQNNSIQLFESAKTGEKLNINFVSFNYTKVLDVLIGTIREKVKEKDSPIVYGRPIHVHGTLSNGLTLGIDNLSQLDGIKYPVSELGKCAIIKPFFNSVFDIDRVESGMAAIRNSDLICVYGMSLGDSDLSWRNALLQWLRESADHHLVIFIHKYSVFDDFLPWKKIMVEDQAKSETLKILGFKEDEIEFYKPQLHIPVGENIFNVSTVEVTCIIGSDVAHPPANIY